MSSKIVGSDGAFSPMTIRFYPIEKRDAKKDPLYLAKGLINLNKTILVIQPLLRAILYAHLPV